MRKLISSTLLGLDGVIGDPQLWPKAAGEPDERFGALQYELLRASDALIMGRRTYEGFAPVWRSMSGDPFSDRMNAIPKYVVSTTLTDPTWNGSVVTDDPVGVVRKLKDEPGGHLLQYGFGDVTRTLLAAGLVDALQVFVHPLLVGSATTDDLLFRPGPAVLLRHTETVVLRDGLVVLDYDVVRG